MAFFDHRNPDDQKRMSEYFGPQIADQGIRHAIQACWMALPAEQKTVAEVERQIRRLVDRALRDLREDADSFGLPKG